MNRIAAPDSMLELFSARQSLVGARYRFSGHQTFPFRYPWLPKAVRGLAADSSLFLREEAVVHLGVGKNMVVSMRHWCEALGLAHTDGRAGKTTVTELGEALFGAQGWDPYLEDTGTLWLLHWKLVESPEAASTWFLAFTRWYKDAFSKDEIVVWLQQIAQQAPSSRASIGTLRRDVDTFLRTYVPAASGGRQRAIEDSFDCPLVELGLIREAQQGLYEFVRGPKPTLPVGVLAYAIAQYWDTNATEQETLHFERLLYGAGSPGAAFKLSESALVALLEEMPRWTGFQYDETAGLRVLLRTGKVPPHALLERHYGRTQESGRWNRS